LDKTRGTYSQREIWAKIVAVKDATEKWYIKLNRVKKIPKRLGEQLERTHQQI
jgi:hypothetical protein